MGVLFAKFINTNEAVQRASVQIRTEGCFYQNLLGK